MFSVHKTASGESVSHWNPSCKKGLLSPLPLATAWLVMVVVGTEEPAELEEDSTSRFDDGVISEEEGGPCNPVSGDAWVPVLLPSTLALFGGDLDDSAE